MQKLYQQSAIMCTFVIIFLYSCNNDKRNLSNLYKEREYLLQEFKGKSILNRSQHFYQLSYYKGEFVNTFFFEKNGNILTFTNDTLQYPVTEIAAFTSINVADSLAYIKSLNYELGRLLKVMDDLKIDGVDAGFVPLGVDMKIYFGDYKALLYISDIKEIKNERWKSYVISGRKLDDNWYYVKDELKNNQ